MDVENTLAELGEDIKHHNRRERHRFPAGSSRPTQHRVTNRNQISRAARPPLSAGGGGLAGARPLLAGLLLAPRLFPGPLPAQTNAAKAAPPHRCLLIVDTSRPMQRRAAARSSAVEELLTSGLRASSGGATLGVWTFNDCSTLATSTPNLVTGPAGITARPLTFLKVQK